MTVRNFFMVFLWLFDDYGFSPGGSLVCGYGVDPFQEGLECDVFLQEGDVPLGGDGYQVDGLVLAVGIHSLHQVVYGNSR